jgi:hypothetical protein
MDEFDISNEFNVQMDDEEENDDDELQHLEELK